jgi:hypothetical protein
VARVTAALGERGIRVMSARPVAATLEDVFIGLIGEARSGQ